MTTSAWIMLAVTWSAILFFTGKFFWMVLETPPKPDHEEEKDR
jgi:hypothetical protein